MDLLPRLVSYVQQGGWVMIPLGGVSLVLWFLIGERLLAFRELERDDVGIMACVSALAIRRDDWSGLLPQPGGGKRIGSKSALRSRFMNMFLGQRTGNPSLDRNILHECNLKIRPELNRNIAAIAVLSAVAPLLGLLGTVIGMIDTFEVIALFGTGNAKALAGGISVALVTTQSGLLVAIPGMLLSAFLARRAMRLRQNLDQVTLVLTNNL